MLEFYERHPEKKMALVSVNVQKAFNNINWVFIPQALEQRNFDPRLRGMVEGIYLKPSAKLKINGELTKEVQIRQGTRQGCPLSPLLIILTLEILNTKISEDEKIKGLKIKQEEFKIKAYADDLIIILEDPLISMKYLIEVLELWPDYGAKNKL